MLKFEVSAEVWMLHFFLKVARLYPKTKLMDKLHSYCITNDTVYLEHRHRVLLKNSIQLMVAKYCYLFLPRFCLWGQSASEKITFPFISFRVAFIFVPCFGVYILFLLLWLPGVYIISLLLWLLEEYLLSLLAFLSGDYVLSLLVFL